MSTKNGGGGGLPLFETKAAAAAAAKGKRVVGPAYYKVFAGTVFVGICLILFYRLKNIPGSGPGEPVLKRWAWIGMLMAELWFSFYWIITQSVRWNVIYRFPFKDRLSLRYEEELPGVDIFVCCADPKLEPPTLVINTVLSLMSYNYPSYKLSLYLSDDGGSELTFLALLEASNFSKYWIPFCKNFKVETRSPAAYFAHHIPHSKNPAFTQNWLATKKLYNEMKMRIEAAMERGSISKELKQLHKGFSEWNSQVTKQDHQSIVQILIDGRNPNEIDVEGNQLPTLVYLAREKRPQWPHNFKAGSMNSLIRVSSEISNGAIILNLDCDMYANDPDALREALCFFMDEEHGYDLAYVQHPQCYENITKNDIYANAANVVSEVELAGIGGYNAALYCGTGCFHRRESLSGMKFSNYESGQWNSETEKTNHKTVEELEEASKVLANCSFEKGTQWGKEMGLVYGCPVEDIVTGLTIQCRGWKSFFYNPEKSAFLGVAPTTLEIALVQFKRWSEGMFQIFLSKYCPFIYGHGKIKLGAQMGYCVYLLWAPNALPTLYYAIVPSLCFLRGLSLFPKVTSIWFLPFAYVFVARNASSLAETLNCGDTFRVWWNMQRMWVIRRTTSFLFGFIDTVARQIGLSSQTTFAVTAKVVDEDVLKRYEQEIIEFGSSSILFTIISTLALVNFASLVVGILRRVFWEMEEGSIDLPQMVLCGVLVMVNLPVYEALFVRNDKGCIPSSVMFKSVMVASMACLIALC